MLLLYNTFRVLKPAFSGIPSSRQGSDLEAQSQGKDSAGSFSGEKSFASWDEKTIAAPSLAKVPGSYRVSDSSITASFYSQSSQKPFLNKLSTSELSRTTTAESLGRPITPIDELQRAAEQHARTNSSSTTSTLKPPRPSLDTTGQPFALTPPPRPHRSPVKRHPSHTAMASQYTRDAPAASKKLMKKVSLSAVVAQAQSGNGAPRTPTTPRSFASPTRGFATLASATSPRSFSSPSEYSGAESEIPLSPYLEAYVSLPLPPLPTETSK